MIAIRVTSELWGTNILPQGILQAWLRPDGALVQAGDPIASVQIEDALHELLAPARGRLRTGSRANSIIEPGSVIGHLTAS